MRNCTHGNPIDQPCVHCEAGTFEVHTYRAPGMVERSHD